MNPDHYKTRLLFAFHVLLAGLVLTIIGVSAWGLLHLPTDGLIVSSETHVVSFVDPLGSNAGKLRLGDIVRSINGVSLDDEAAATEQYLSQLQFGNVLTFEVYRPGADGAQAIMRVPIEVGAPSWLMALLLLGSTITALAFWLVSLPVLFFAPDERRGYLFFYFCLAWAAFLAGATLSEQSGLVMLLYALLTWTLGAITIHFHCYFPVFLAQQRRWWIAAGYTIAALGVLLQLGLHLAPNLEWGAEVGVLRFAWLLLTLVLSIIFILRAYLFYQASPYTRRQVGLITVGGLLAFLPLIVFSALPELLQGYPILPYLATIYFLAAIPLTYGYAALQFNFIYFERYASRSSTLLLTFTLTSGLYIVVSTGVSRLVQIPTSHTPGSLLVVMLPALTFWPLYKRVRIYVDKLFYGGWYDYTTVVGEVSSRLEDAAAADSPAQLFSETLQSVMQLKWVAVLLPDNRGLGKEIALAGYAGELKDASWLQNLALELDGALVAFLRQSLQPCSKQTAEAHIRHLPLTLAEQALLRQPAIRLFVPFHALSETIGIFVLGPKYGDDIFDANDLGILNVVARQTSLAIQNAQLITRLKEKAEETERYQREVIRAREEERKRIARELHDQLIQALVGLKYQIAGLKPFARAEPTNGEQHEQITHLHAEIGDLIQTTRSLCNDLRPPALDLGLVPSIRSLVSRFQQTNGITVHLHVDGDRHTIIPEDVALCLFRCTHEALTNIARHAAAQNAYVHIDVDAARVTLKVKDDGQGFVLPERLGSLMEMQHFGLVSMRERVELLHGVFTIQSGLGQGTEIAVAITLP
ncbi:MAG: hypothetical protein Fur0021_18350 [Candidatus Promineifilaceae bacterium]